MLVGLEPVTKKLGGCFTTELLCIKLKKEEKKNLKTQKR